MVYYEPVKVTIDTLRLAEVIIDVMIQHQRLSDSIINNWKAIFMSKFWSLLCSLFNIK